MNAAACPPSLPTLRSVTADSSSPSSRSSRASRRASRRSACSDPRCRETASSGRRCRRQARRGVHEQVAFGQRRPRRRSDPSRAASCLSGRIAIRLPPAVTQFVNIVTCAAVSGISPRITTSYVDETVAVTVRDVHRREGVQAFGAQDLRVVAAERIRRCASTTRIGPPGPSVGGGGGGAAVVNDHVKSLASALPASVLHAAGAAHDARRVAVEYASAADRRQRRGPRPAE